MSGQRYYYYAEPAKKRTAQIQVRKTKAGATTTISYEGKVVGTLRFKRIGTARVRGKPVLRNTAVFLDQRFMGKGLAMQAMVGTMRFLRGYWFVPDTNVSVRALALYRRLGSRADVTTTPAARFRSCHKLAVWRWELPRPGTGAWHGWYPIGYSRDRVASRVHPACKKAYRWVG
jgi:hypothetical protein